jgi:hypothetical protein
MKRAVLGVAFVLLVASACSGKGNTGKVEVDPLLVQQVPWLNGRPAQHDDTGKAVVPGRFDVLHYPRIGLGVADPGSRVFDPNETDHSQACEALRGIELSSWRHHFEPTGDGLVGVAQFWSNYFDATDGAWLVPGDASWYPETASLRDGAIWGLASEKIDNAQRAQLGDAPLGLPTCGEATPNLHALHLRGGRFNHFGGGAEHPLNLDCTMGAPAGYAGDICRPDTMLTEMVDVSSYDGIAFWARRGPEGAGGLQLGIQTKDTSDYLARSGKLGGKYCQRIKTCAPQCDDGAECVEVTQNDPPATRLRCVPPGADPNKTPEPSLLELLYPQCGVDTCKGPPYFMDPDFGPDNLPAAECKPYTFSGLEESYWCFYDAPAAPGDRCGDGFVSNVSLSTEWTFYKLPFESFRQVGFAKHVDRFDLKNVFSIALQFSVGYVDFYVDNVSFYRNE